MVLHASIAGASRSFIKLCRSCDTEGSVLEPGRRLGFNNINERRPEGRSREKC